MTETLRRQIPKDLPDGTHLEVEIELRGDDPRGLSPGFAITLSGWEQRGKQTGLSRMRQGRDIDYGGADHETILRVFPELAPLVALHLSDPDGTPMHAEANAWYWYSSYDGKGTHIVDREHYGSDLDILARHLRLDVADIPEGLDREAFAAFVAEQRARWAREADTGRAIIEAIPTLYEIRGYDESGTAVEQRPYDPAAVIAAHATVE